MRAGPVTLVCFAVKEEANPFKERAVALAQVETLLTGMGPRNAEQAIKAAITARRPGLVLSCGFTGGLRPELVSGAVVFGADRESGLEPALLAAGARPGKFHFVSKVATTADEKRALWETTGADAVEMESEIICAVCREQKIPSAIVRVILDTAGEDLPLDFNRLMNDKQQMDYGKLALALLKSPGKVGSLLRLQKQSQAAAEKLAQVLAEVLK
jgi:nucleoside phosphorylase